MSAIRSFIVTKAENIAEEGRRKKEEGRRKKRNAIKSTVLAIENLLTAEKFAMKTRGENRMKGKQGK